jgi:predicted nuclease of restriction endonuclease-like (RecB) superfamily
MRKRRTPGDTPARRRDPHPVEASFAEVVALIQTARRRAFQAVNTELIALYWRIGEYLHHKIDADGWAKGTVVQLAAYIEKRERGLRGFSPQNLWRMRQFFEAYCDAPGLSPLVRELPWTHNLIILAQSRRPAEREFYLRTAIQEGWSKRELERQLRLGAFERAVLNPPKLSPAVRVLHGQSAAERGGRSGDRRLRAVSRSRARYPGGGAVRAEAASITIATIPSTRITAYILSKRSDGLPRSRS